MTKTQWQAFVTFRQKFKDECEALSHHASILSALAAEAASKDTPLYQHETAVVYNRALDEITEKSDIRYIIVGDNPGKDEQLIVNNRYLVGQSGKLGDRFFRMTKELEADFRKNVIILNKTPIHTAKTNHLRFLAKSNKDIARLINDSQKWMATETAFLHRALVSSSAEDAFVDGASKNSYTPELWLVGYAELKNKGIFALYRDTLRKAYDNDNAAWNQVKVYQHFSMNRFSIDFKKWREKHPHQNTLSALSSLGDFHRTEIFGA